MKLKWLDQENGMAAEASAWEQNKHARQETESKTKGLKDKIKKGIWGREGGLICASVLSERKGRRGGGKNNYKVKFQRSQIKSKDGRVGHEMKY